MAATESVMLMLNNPNAEDLTEEEHEEGAVEGIEMHPEGLALTDSRGNLLTYIEQQALIELVISWHNEGV